VSDLLFVFLVPRVVTLLTVSDLHSVISGTLCCYSTNCVWTYFLDFWCRAKQRVAEQAGWGSTSSQQTGTVTERPRLGLFLNNDQGVW
jgi:hypothetical protein